nr:hypothetical transcript [Hymenolepis microstoma]CUU98488.1 hypothetical transcript [Hymenolepis microstoma]
MTNEVSLAKPISHFMGAVSKVVTQIESKDTLLYNQDLIWSQTKAVWLRLVGSIQPTSYPGIFSVALGYAREVCHKLLYYQQRKTNQSDRYSRYSRRLR